MEKTTVRVGPGLFGCLGILFLTLKLCGVIDWAWWLVLLPFYGPLAAIVAFLALSAFAAGTLVVFAMILDLIENKKG